MLSEYSRRDAKGTGSARVRALAQERGNISEAAPFLFSPYAPSIKVSAPSVVAPEGARTGLGNIRTLPRISELAACVGTSFRRACDV